MKQSFSLYQKILNQCLSFFHFQLHLVFVAAGRLSLVMASGGYSLVVMRGLLNVVASLDTEHAV